MGIRKLSLTTFTLAALCTVAWGQTPKQTPFTQVTGAEWNQRLGSAMAAVGDHNGDGAEDLLVGAPGGANKIGRAFLVSGADGTLLRTLQGEAIGDQFGSTLAYAGDVNADGHPDVIVGTEGVNLMGRAYVFSGMDGALLHLFQFPFGHGRVADVGGGADVDGDGHDDLILGLPAAFNPFPLERGLVYVFSGVDGSELHRLTGNGSSGIGNGGINYGVQVALMGDADGDGLSEFAISASFDGTVGPAAGKVTIHSGADASVVHEFFPPTDLDQFGTTLAPAGDLDGDGRQDLAVGTPNEEKNLIFNNIGQGSVRVFSGRDGSTLLTIWGPQGQDHLGTSLAAGGDINGDGVGDLISGMPGKGPGYFPVVGGRALVISGATGGTIEIYTHAHTSFGGAVALLADVNGDGRADPVVAAPLESTIKKSAGLANVYVGACASVEDYCTAGTSVGGCSPLLTTGGQASATKTSGFRLDVSNADGGARGLAFFGVSGKQAHPFRGAGFQCVVPPLRITATVGAGGTTGACDGALSIDLNDHWSLLRPEHNPGAGTQTQAQVLLRSGRDGPPVLTSAVQFTLCP
jgi:hypothetical protein